MTQWIYLVGLEGDHSSGGWGIELAAFSGKKHHVVVAEEEVHWEGGR